MRSLEQKFINVFKSEFGLSELPLHEPIFDGNEKLYLAECITSGFVSSVGSFVRDFENKLASYTKVKFAIATTNGTAALQISLLALGVKPEDEILVPAMTFVATGNAISYCNAIPHFVDCEEDSLGVDPVELRKYLNSICYVDNGKTRNKKTNRIIRGLIVMHTFGLVGRIDKLIEVAKEFNLFLLEDSAESRGSKFGNKHAGTFGNIGTLSFNGNKIITTGGGGAILTNDENTAAWVRHMTTTAKVSHNWDFIHDQIGFNFRMPNLNAALGLAQFENLNRNLEAKRKLHDRYNDVFSNWDDFEIIHERENTESNYWLNTIKLKPHILHKKNTILDLANQAGIKIRPVWALLPDLGIYKNFESMPLPVAKYMRQSIINIPSSPILGLS